VPVAETSAPKEEAALEPPKPAKSAERDAMTAAYKAGNYKEALAISKRLPQPLDGDAAFMTCDSQRQTGAPAALDCYLEFAKSYPTHHRVDDAQFWAADLYTSQGKAKEARALYEKVAANEKSNFRTSAAKRLEKQ
jgi:TolA-binding protein